MIPEIDLIVCDVDGCLASENGGNFDITRLTQLAAYNRRAIETGSAPPITVCTGRPQPFAEAMCRLLGNDKVPCIAEMGVWLYHPGSNLYEMDPSILPEHLELIDEAAKVICEMFRSDGITRQPGKTASLALFHSVPAILEAAIPKIRDLAVKRDWPLRTSMTWNYINCELMHISKGSGLRRLFATTDYDPLRTAGIGDTTSDLPMADLLGWFACPANAAEAIRAEAQYTSPHEETAGVVDIVTQITGEAFG